MKKPLTMFDVAPRPWTIVNNSWQYTTIYDGSGAVVCTLDLEDWHVSESTQDALERVQKLVAELIVHSVNSAKPTNSKRDRG